MASLTHQDSDAIKNFYFVFTKDFSTSTRLLVDCMKSVIQPVATTKPEFENWKTISNGHFGVLGLTRSLYKKNHHDCNVFMGRKFRLRP